MQSQLELLACFLKSFHLHELISAAEMLLGRSTRISGGGTASQKHHEEEAKYGHREIVSGLVAVAQWKTREMNDASITRGSHDQLVVSIHRGLVPPDSKSPR